MTKLLHNSDGDLVSTNREHVTLSPYSAEYLKDYGYLWLMTSACIPTKVN